MIVWGFVYISGGYKSGWAKVWLKFSSWELHSLFKFFLMIKAMDLWLPGYLAQKRNPSRSDNSYILLAVCDHYEPWHQATRGQEEALQRLSRWQDAYPKVQSIARDSDGLPPVHTFFFQLNSMIIWWLRN